MILLLILPSSCYIFPCKLVTRIWYLIKYVTGCTPDSLFSKYIQRATITKCTTRNPQMLNIPLYKTATGQRTLYFRTVELWNSLASTLKLKPTLKDFKLCLKRSLTSNLFRDLIAFFIFI